MAASQTTPQTPSLPWRGFHHVAVVTSDLDATIAFYTDVLGMQVSARYPATDRNGQHCFIKPGSTESWGLHVFERADAQIFQFPAEMQRFVFIPGALQHIAFALPSLADGLALRERLASFGIAATGINTIGPIQNILFRDNNGIVLEATWSKE